MYVSTVICLTDLVLNQVPSPPVWESYFEEKIAILASILLNIVLTQSFQLGYCFIEIYLNSNETALFCSLHHATNLLQHQPFFTLSITLLSSHLCEIASLYN